MDVSDFNIRVMTLLPHVTCIVWRNSWFRRYKRTSFVTMGNHNRVCLIYQWELLLLIFYVGGLFWHFLIFLVGWSLLSLSQYFNMMWSLLVCSTIFKWGGLYCHYRLIWRVKMYYTRLKHLWKRSLNSGVVFFFRVFTVLCCQYVCVILFCQCQWLYM